MTKTNDKSKRVWWNRVSAGHYVTTDGWQVRQAQGDLYPRWMVIHPGEDQVRGVDWTASTLCGARAVVEQEAKR